MESDTTAPATDTHEPPAAAPPPRKAAPKRGPPARFAARAAAVPAVFVVHRDARTVSRVPVASLKDSSADVRLAALKDFRGSAVTDADELVVGACYFEDAAGRQAPAAQNRSVQPPHCRDIELSTPQISPRPAPAQADPTPCVLLGYDAVMLGHVSPSDRYPERPQRLQHAARLLVEAGYALPQCDRDTHSNEETRAETTPGTIRGANEEGTVKVVPGRPATWDEIRLVHPQPEYEAFCTQGRVVFNAEALASNDIYVSAESDHGCATQRAALAAAGICVDATCGAIAHASCAVRVSEASPKSHAGAFCLVRPPGHHCSHVPAAFCVFNNVMVAVANAVRSAPLQELAVREGRRIRVAIIDLDVHHGDGTQRIADIWNADPERLCDVLFVSTHRYDGGAFFPKSGHPHAVGPSGLNVNVGFDTARKREPAHVMCDDTFDLIDWHLLRPLLGKDGPFPPDLVMVSCGFDAAEGDPLGGMSVVRGFHRVVRSLRVNVPTALATVAVLEGGYDVEAVGQATVRVVRALENPCRDPQPGLPALTWVQDAVKEWSPSTSETAAAVMPADIVKRTLHATRRRHRDWALSAMLRTAEALAEAPGASAVGAWARETWAPRLRALLATSPAPT